MPTPQNPAPTHTQNFQPYANWLLVQPLSPQELSPGGLLLPRKDHDLLTAWATVLDTGPGLYSDREKRFLPISASPGDLVVYNKNLTLQFAQPDGSYAHLLQEPNILAILHPKSTTHSSL